MAVALGLSLSLLNVGCVSPHASVERLGWEDGPGDTQRVVLCLEQWKGLPQGELQLDIPRDWADRPRRLGAEGQLALEHPLPFSPEPFDGDRSALCPLDAAYHLPKASDKEWLETTAATASPFRLLVDNLSGDERCRRLVLIGRDRSTGDQVELLRADLAPRDAGGVWTDGESGGPLAFLANRIRDVSDIIDPKLEVGLGCGVKVELTQWIGAGIGGGNASWSWESFGRTGTLAREEYGRPAWKRRYFLLAGVEDRVNEEFEIEVQSLIVLIRFRDDRNTPLDRFRVGAEVWLPGTSVGMYLNTGEVVDFLAGLVGLDPAGDDGLPKFGW